MDEEKKPSPVGTPSFSPYREDVSTFDAKPINPPVPGIPTPPAHLSPEKLQRLVGVEKKIMERDVPNIRTYQADIAETVQKNNTSMVKIALAEARKREKEVVFEEETSKISHRNIILVILSLLLIGGSISATAFIYLFKNTEEPVIIQTLGKDVIIPDVEHSIDLTGLKRERVLEFLQKEIASNSEVVGTLVKINLFLREAENKRMMQSQEFFSQIGEHIPAPLLRSFDKNFFLGVHIFEENNPFIIVKTTSYQSAFAGMLDWEQDMLYDLKDIFARNPSEDSDPESAFGNQKFKDAVVFNKDSRVIKDETGKVIFLYSFLDSQTLLIANTEGTLREVSERLRAAKLSK